MEIYPEIRISCLVDKLFSVLIFFSFFFCFFLALFLLVRNQQVQFSLCLKSAYIHPNLAYEPIIVD